MNTIIKSLGVVLCCLPLFFIPATNAQISDINTYAGNGIAGYYGDGGAAISAELYLPAGILNTGSGIVITDQYNNRVRMVSTSGVISTFAGNGISGYSGDGSAATAAELNSPAGITMDAANNIYISDTYNNVIRKVNTSGIISTVAGNGYDAGSGYGSYSGDGGAATAASLNLPAGIASTGAGTIYIADSYNNVIRKVNTSGVISTIAGGRGQGYSGDGGSATAAELDFPAGVAVDGSGNIYIADQNNNVIRKINTSGIISTIAGNGYGAGLGYAADGGYSGDGGQATAAELSYPAEVTVDTSTGNVYIADSYNNVIRMVNTSGVISTVAGNGFDAGTYFGSYSGDGGPATAAGLYYPADVAVGGSGNLYIADQDNNVIRNVCASLSTPGSIGGDTLVCLGSSQSYSITAVSGATSYTWTLPYGWSDTSTTTSITIDSVTGGGIISVTANNDCGSSAAQTLTVTIPSPPSAPDTIFGDVTFCPGATIRYSIAKVTGAYTYSWTLPSGWTGSSTDTTITATADSNSGIVEVYAIGCGGNGSIQSLFVNLGPPPPAPDTIFGDTTFCPGAVLNYTINKVIGATSYAWTLPYGWTGSSTDTIITATADSSNGGIIEVSANGCGSSSSLQSLFVNLVPPLPAPDTILGNLIFCPGSIQKYAINTVTGATSYTWTLPYGWTGSSTDTSITVTTDSNSGFVEVTANDCAGSGYFQWAFVNLLTLPPPSICYVTVDTLYNRNDIFWDKSAWDTLAIDSIRLYKESATSYVKIGEVSIHDTGSFIDTGSRPNAVSNFYEMAVVDTCGQLSALGSYQETILLQASLGVGSVVNLSWNSYIGDYVDYYKIMRDDYGTGAWHKLDSVPNSIFAYTDNAPSPSPDCKYMITTIWDLDCTPSIHHAATRRVATINSTAPSESNIENITVTGIDELNPPSPIETYPNPVKDELNVVFHESAVDGVVTIINVLGQDVYSEKITDKETTLHINTSELQEGIYILKVETNGQVLLKKIVKI